MICTHYAAKLITNFSKYGHQLHTGLHYGNTVSSLVKNCMMVTGRLRRVP